jgi:hypothetical protein
VLQADPSGNYVITDCRFENEIMAIKNLGGTIISVSRGADPDWAEDAMAGAQNPAPDRIHATDWNVFALRRYADKHIKNNGTLHDLNYTVECTLFR